MRKLFLFLALVLLLAVTVVPATAQDGGTILDIAANDADFSTLVAAVEAADPAVAQALAGPGPLTIFAPTNQAFENLDTYLNDNFGVTLDDVVANEEVITNLLLYHVINGAVNSATLAGLDDSVVPTLYPGTGIGVVVNDDGSIGLNGGVATVTTADISADNGIVHVIDNVIFNSAIVADIQTFAEELAFEELVASLGNSVAGVAATNEDFSILFAAIDAAGLTDFFNESRPITVFAPTNEAFTALLESIGLTPEDALGQPDLLETVLRYHVIPGEVSAEDLAGMDGEEVLSFLDRVSRSTGTPISISVGDDGAITLNDSVNIVDSDIEADNGLIHVIDGVLLPPDVAALLGG